MIRFKFIGPFLAAALMLISQEITRSQVTLVNFLDETVYGIENGGSGWWMQHPDYWGVTSEKSASGSYSLKYHCEDFSVVTTQLKAHGGNPDVPGSRVNLDPGTYTMSVKVWLSPDAAVTGMNTTIKTPWIPKSWNFNGIARGEWVELNQPLVLDAPVVESNLLVLVTLENGGNGTLYVDDIAIFSEAPGEPPEIPYLILVETLEAAALNLEKGNYTASLKVWIDPDAGISRFYTQILEPWTTLMWNLDTLPRAQWVALSQEIALDSGAVNSSFRILVPSNPTYGGGKGDFYIDDISFEKNTTYLPVVPVMKTMIYPNPVSEILTVESTEACTLIIYNLSGQAVKSVPEPARHFVIPVAALSPGIYILHMTETGRTHTHKIIIQ